MAQESGPGRPISLFDPAPEDEQTPLLNLTARIEAARSQAAPAPPDSRNESRPPPPGGGRPDFGAAVPPPRRRKLVFSPADGDRKPALTPIQDLPQRARSSRPFALSRIAWVSGAIVVFVFLNATLLGYLPFVERRPTPPLRPLRQATQTVTTPVEPPARTPPVAAGAPAFMPRPALEPAFGSRAIATSAAPLSPPPSARIAPSASLIAPAPTVQTKPPAALALAPSTPGPLKRAPLPLSAAPQPRAAALAPALSSVPVSASAHAAPLASARAPTSPAAPRAPAPSLTKSAPVPSATPAFGGETFAVQVGAFKTDGLAAAAADRAIAAGPAGGGALAGRREPVQKDGSTLYRALVSGFATSKDAARFCATLQTTGVACFIKH